MLWVSQYLCAFLFIIVQLECKKRDIIYTDAELEKLFDQWEENDIDENNDFGTNSPIHKLDFHTNSPDDLVKLSKKGKSVMMFVSVKNPNEHSTSKQFTEKISSLWQSNFYNNHIEAQSFIVDDDRILYLFKEGSQAWDARDFVIKQNECNEILLEGKIMKGPSAQDILKDEL